MLKIKDRPCEMVKERERRRKEAETKTRPRLPYREAFSGARIKEVKQQFLAGWLKPGLLIDLQVTADVGGALTRLSLPHTLPHPPILAPLRSLSLSLSL